jgi:hypothetical protein
MSKALGPSCMYVLKLDVFHTVLHLCTKIFFLLSRVCDVCLINADLVSLFSFKATKNTTCKRDICLCVCMCVCVCGHISRIYIHPFTSIDITCSLPTNTCYVCMCMCIFVFILKNKRSCLQCVYTYMRI